MSRFGLYAYHYRRWTLARRAPAGDRGRAATGSASSTRPGRSGSATRNPRARAPTRRSRTPPGSRRRRASVVVVDAGGSADLSRRTNDASVTRTLRTDRGDRAGDRPGRRLPGRRLTSDNGSRALVAGLPGARRSRTPRRSGERALEAFDGVSDVNVGGVARRRGTAERRNRGGPAPDRALRGAVPAADLAPRLPGPRRRAAPAAGRRPLDRVHAGRAARAHRGDGGRHLRPQRDHRPRARPRDRLQPVHGLPLPGGDRDRTARGAGALGTTLAPVGPDGPVQRRDRGRLGGRARRVPAALPLLDRHRLRPGRRHLGRRGPARAPGGPRDSRRAGQRGLARPAAAVRDSLRRGGTGSLGSCSRGPCPSPSS